MIFWGADAPQKIIGGGIYYQYIFFSTCGTKIRRIFETSYYVILGRFFGVLTPSKNHRGDIYYQ